jgi:hypothetical protein
MAIFYKPSGSSSKVAVFPFMKSGSSYPRMIPNWKAGSTIANYPGGAYHVLQFKHTGWTCSSVGTYCWDTDKNKAGSYHISAAPEPLKVYYGHGYISTYMKSSTTGCYLVNPYYFVDIDTKSTRAFRTNMWSWTDPKMHAASSAGGPWVYGTSVGQNKAGKMGIIYCDNKAGNQLETGDYIDYKVSRPTDLIYGFIPYLNKKDLWPSTAMRVVFGAIIAVPQDRTEHPISMYYKGCTKNQFYHHNYPPAQYPRKKNNSAYYDHYTYAPYYPSNSMRQILSGYYTQSDIEGPGFDSGHVKQIMNDGTYKYICVKGWDTITSANTDIFTPGGVAYNGPSSPMIVDSWVSFHAQT